MVSCPTPGGEPAGDGGADCALSAGHGRTGGRVSGPWTYASGAVFADLAAAVAGEADCERLPPHFPSIPNPPIRDDSPPGRQWAEVLVMKCLAVSTCA